MRNAFNQEIDLANLPRTGRNQYGHEILNFPSRDGARATVASARSKFSKVTAADVEMLAAKLANETRSERIYRKKQRAKR